MQNKQEIGALSISLTRTSLLYTPEITKQDCENFLKSFPACESSLSPSKCNLCLQPTCKYFKPLTVQCSTCLLPVKALTTYYVNANNILDACCAGCFKKLSKEEKKNKILTKNDKVYEEPTIICTYCANPFHVTCAMANITTDVANRFDDFICVKCMLAWMNQNASTQMHYPSSWKRYYGGNQTLKDTVLSITLEKALEAIQVENMKVYEFFSNKKEKIIGILQKQDGCFILLFVCVVQYGSLPVEYLESNSDSHQTFPAQTDCMYISYIDSVHYFTPKQKRTEMYQTVLLGIMDFARKHQGITKCFLWSFPPLDGVEYIFNCHPPEQKVPKSANLAQWYHALFRKGMERGLVVEYKNLHEYIAKEQIKNAYELPYFDGDFWPGEYFPNHPITQNNEAVFALIEKFQTQLLMCYLTPLPIPESVVEEDVLFPFFSNRVAFLDHCSSSMFQFDTLQKAKYSTAMILYYLKNPKVDFQVFFCNQCGKRIPASSVYFTVENHENYELCYNCSTFFSGGDLITKNYPVIHQLERFHEDRPQVIEHECGKEDGRCLFCIENGMAAHARLCITDTCPVKMCQKYKKMHELKKQKYNRKRSYLLINNI